MLLSACFPRDNHVHDPKKPGCGRVLLLLSTVCHSSGLVANTHHLWKQHTRHHRRYTLAVAISAARCPAILYVRWLLIVVEIVLFNAPCPMSCRFIDACLSLNASPNISILSEKLMPNSFDTFDAKSIDCLNLPKPCVATTFELRFINSAASPKL